MKLSIRIDSENEACSTREDVRAILSRLINSGKLSNAESGQEYTIRDLNGNTVGSYCMNFSIEDEEENE